MGKVDVTDRELAMAEQLIESLSAEFEPDKFEDTYRDQRARADRAQGGGRDRVVPAPQPVDADKVVDLMAALEASVQRGQGGPQAPPDSAARRRQAG